MPPSPGPRVAGVEHAGLQAGVVPAGLTPGALPLDARLVYHDPDVTAAHVVAHVVLLGR